jgi:hypothetical protein
VSEIGFRVKLLTCPVKTILLSLFCKGSAETSAIVNPPDLRDGVVLAKVLKDCILQLHQRRTCLQAKGEQKHQRRYR